MLISTSYSPITDNRNYKTRIRSTFQSIFLIDFSKSAFFQVIFILVGIHHLVFVLKTEADNVTLDRLPSVHPTEMAADIAALCKRSVSDITGQMNTSVHCVNAHTKMKSTKRFGVSMNEYYLYRRIVVFTEIYGFLLW